MQLRDLIERAAERAGSHKNVADQLGVTRQRVDEWKAGRRPCPLEAQAQIAEIAGEDAREWVWREVRRRLGKPLQALGVLALCFGAIVAAPRAEAAGSSANV